MSNLDKLLKELGITVAKLERAIGEMAMQDMSGKEVIEVKIDRDAEGYKVWVNVNGVCRFRAYRTRNVVLDIISDLLKRKAYDTEAKRGGAE